MSEALLFAEHGGNMLCTKIVLNVRNNFCTQHVLPRFELGIFHVLNLWFNEQSVVILLVDAKIRASNKDLPVLVEFDLSHLFQKWLYWWAPSLYENGSRSWKRWVEKSAFLNVVLLYIGMFQFQIHQNNGNGKMVHWKTRQVFCSQM